MSLIRSLRRQWDTRNAGWTLAEEQVAGLENGGRKAPNEASGLFPSVKRRNPRRPLAQSVRKWLPTLAAIHRWVCPGSKVRSNHEQSTDR